MNQVKTLALLGLLSGFLVFLGNALGGTSGALLGLGFAAVTNLISWYSSDKIAFAAYQAQPVSRQAAPDLYAMVERLTRSAEMPMPKLYVVPSTAANAFATGRDPEHAAVAVTQGILDLLPPDWFGSGRDREGSNRCLRGLWCFLRKTTTVSLIWKPST